MTMGDRIKELRTEAGMTQEELADKLGIGIRFHDLRAYAASVMMLIGIPRTYIEEAGGWKHGSSVLDEHYLRTFQSKKESFAEQAAEKFNDLLTTHEMTHEIRSIFVISLCVPFLSYRNSCNHCSAHSA